MGVDMHAMFWVWCDSDGCNAETADASSRHAAEALALSAGFVERPFGSFAKITRNPRVVENASDG